MTDLYTDPQFIAGLTSVLEPLKARGASQEEIDEVTQRAEQFYLSFASSTSNGAAEDSAVPVDVASSSDGQQVNGDAATASEQQKPVEPPYPTDFASLAALISSGQPIPGIRDIPDRLADGEPSTAVLAAGEEGKKRGLKPWERKADGSEDDATAS